MFGDAGYKFFCFPTPRVRMHVFVICPAGRAKFWLEPQIERAGDLETRLSDDALQEVVEVIKLHAADLGAAWDRALPV
jgi:hypothetical protein